MGHPVRLESPDETGSIGSDDIEACSKVKLECEAEVVDCWVDLRHGVLEVKRGSELEVRRAKLINVDLFKSDQLQPRAKMQRLL